GERHESRWKIGGLVSPRSFRPEGAVENSPGRHNGLQTFWASAESLPSPLAGEGGERRSREPGEGTTPPFLRGGSLSRSARWSAHRGGRRHWSGRRRLPLTRPVAPLPA